MLAAGVAAVTAITLKSVSDFTTYAGAIHDIGQESGLAAPTLSTIAAYARLVGANVNQASSALEIYFKNAAEAAHGNEAMAKTFIRFGLDGKKVISDVDAGARDLFDHLAKIQNPAERLDAAFKLAGKSGKVLANIAVEMGGDFNEAMAAAREWGQVLTEDDIRAADKFGDAWEVLKMRAEGVIYDIGRGALPELQKAIDDVSGDLDGGHQSWQEWGKEAGGAIREVIEFFKELNDEVKPINDFLNEYSSFGSRFRHGVSPYSTPAGPNDPGHRFGGMVNSPGQLPAGGGSGGGRGAYGGIGDVKGRGGSAESAARKAAQQALELAKIDIRDAQSVVNELTGIQRRTYEMGLNDFHAYVEARLRIAADLFEKEKAGFEAERVAVARLPKAGERDVKLADINQRALAAQREYNQKTADLQLEDTQHQLEIKKKFAEAWIQIGEAMNANEISTQTTQAEKGLRGFEDVEERRFQLQKQVFADRQQLINEDLIRYQKGDQERFRQAQQANEALNQEEQAAQLEHERLLHDARVKDLQDAQSYAQTLRSIYAQVADANAQIMQSQIDVLSSSNFNRGASIEAQRILDRALETARSARTLAGLRGQVSQQDLNPNRQDAVGIVRALNAQIEAEERLHQQRLTDIDRKANEERRQQMVEVADDLASIFSAGFEHIGEGWSAVWRSMLQEAINVLNQIAAELMKMSFEVLLTGKTNGSSGGGLLGFLTNAIGSAVLGSLGGGSFSAGSSAHGILDAFSHGGYATGGSFMVGGPYGTDKTPVHFMASRGERVDILTPAQQRAQGAGGDTYIYNITTPAVRERSYTQKRSQRELAETVAGVLKQRA